MVVPFGVSVGDFIAGIKLIHDIADALKESCSSSSDFRDLIYELRSLERALICVKEAIDPKNRESAPYDISHVDALKQVVLQVRRTIDEFLAKNQKFVLPLGAVEGSGSAVRDWVRKIEWKRYKKEDVQALRWKVNGHLRAVNLVLHSMQLEAVGKSNTLISDMSKCLLVMNTQVSGLQKLADEVFRSNLQIYQDVRAVQTKVPAQVVLQEPVLFWDARGHFAPFHLDFVNSAEAFIAVLKVRFKEVGLNKIERGDFAISEIATKRDIDLLQSWSRCFRPGQKVNMSMIFDLSPRNKDNSCPACGFINSGSSETEIKCAQCNRYYQRFTELPSPQKGLSASTTAGRSGDKQINRNRNSSSSTTSPYKTAGVEEEDEDETLSEYTRVRLRITPTPPVPPASKLQPTGRPGPTSYWSVTEQSDFQRNLEHFGTDWAAIANHMGTKTQTMVKNQYQRLVESGQFAYLERVAQEADLKRGRGEDLGPPPLRKALPPRIWVRRPTATFDTGMKHMNEGRLDLRVESEIL